MTDPGLSNRLRQQSRRAGLMVGVSMALTIAICIGGFTAIYAGLVPYLSDIVALSPRERAAAPASAPEGDSVDAAMPAVATEEPEPRVPPVVPTEPPPAPAIVAGPTARSEAFAPTHQSNSNQSINFRSSPGVPAENSSGNLLYALPPSTPLESLGEEQTVNNEVWIHFRNDQGDEGWVREIDAEPYQEET